MLMVAVGEVLSLQLFDRSAFSISVAPCLAAGMLPGVPGIVVAAPISAIVRGVYRRTRWYKVLFNASTYILAGTAAGLIFQVFGPTLDAQNLPLLLLLAGLAGLAYYTVARYSLQWSWRSRVARACSTCGWSISAGCGRSTSC